MDTRQAPSPPTLGNRVLPTSIAAFVGFVIGLGGGPVGAILTSLVFGGVIYLVSGTKRRPAPTRPALVRSGDRLVFAPPPPPAPAPDPFENTVFDDAEDRYGEVLAVLDEARRDGTISTTQHRSLSAIAHRRMFGEIEIRDAGDAIPATSAPALDPLTFRSAPIEPASPDAPALTEREIIRKPPPPEPLGAPDEPAASSAPAWSARITPPRLDLGTVTAQLRNVWDMLLSDFALHGLAYAGVLLVFVATLGFVIFAFSGVQSGLRPVAEAAIPIMLFGTARFLRHRGAPFVSRALQFLAGAITPVVAFAAFRDGAGFPPDLDDAPLVLVLTAIAAGLAALYARISLNDPTSPLRFLVAPLIWVAVGVVGLVFHAEPSAAQMSLVLIAISTTALIAGLRTRHPLSKPTRDVALPAAGVGMLLLVLFASAEGWPALPALTAGLALLALTEILPLRFRYPSSFQAFLIVGTSALVVPGWGPGVAAAGAAGLFVAFVEIWSHRPESDVNVPLGAALGGLALAVAVVEPWSALVSGFAIGAWGHGRRQTIKSGGEESARSRVVAIASVAAVGAPAPAVSGLWRLAGPEPAVLIAGTVVAAMTLIVWRWARSDALYAYWIPGAAAAVVLATAVLTVATPADVDYRLLAAGAAVAATGFVMAPRWPVVRIWFGSVSILWAMVLGFEAVELAVRFRAPTLAVLGAVTVLAAAGGRDRSLGHLALVGHATAAGSLIVSGAGGPLLVSLAAFTGAWVAETVFTVTDRSVLQQLATQHLPDHRLVPHAVRGAAPLIAAISLPFLVADLATFVDIVTIEQRGRMALLQASLALGYAAVARATMPRRPLAPIMAVGGFLLSGVAIAVAAPEPWPTITALAASLGVVGLIGGELRRPTMSWIAWVISAVLAALLVKQAGLATGRLHLVFLGWGAAGLIGGLGFDDLRMGRRPAGAGLRIDWVLRPVALGALAIPVALSFALDAPPGDGWPALAAAAVVYGIAAVQLRAGLVSIAFYALASYAAALWLETTALAVTDHPWMLSFFTLGLVLVSFAIWALRTERRSWLRWDTAPFVIAHATALVALLLTDQSGSVPAVFAAHGGIALAVSAWRRRWSWALGGTGLVLLGAVAAGPEWLALATGGLAVLTALAATISTRNQTALQWASVVFAGWAWAEVVGWRDWWPDPALLLTAVAGGGLAAALAVALRTGHLALRWALPWMTMSALAVAGPMLVVLGGTGSRLDGSLGVSIGLVGLAAASGLAARPVQQAELRPLAGVLAGLAGPMLVNAYDPSGGTVAALAAPVGFTGVVAGVLVWRLRRSVWAVPFVISATLTFITGVGAGAADAAYGWMAVLLATMAVGSVLGAASTREVARQFLQAGSAILVAAAWGNAVAWAGWWPGPAAEATVVGSACVGLALAMVARFDLLDRSWVHHWGPVAVLVFAVGLLAVPQVGHRPGGLAAAAGLGIWAVALGSAARPLAAPPLRDGAALALLGAGIGLGYGFQPAVGLQVAASLLAGLAATGAAGTLRLWRPESPWIRPAAIYATGAQIGALLVSAQALPETGLLAAALAVVGIGALVLGGLLGLSAFLYAGPPLLLSSWILFAVDAFGGNPQWYTIPLGITILALVDIMRWDARRRDLPVAGEVIAYADYAGMAFMVGASLIQVITRSSAHGLIAIMAGLAILAWSGATRVRRRAWGGATAILAAAVLMVAVPVARIVPQFRGIALWAAIATVGGLLIAAASTLEQGRARVTQSMERLDELMEGWE